MNSTCNENGEDKPKKCNKKSSSVEAIKVTIEKKKQCNSRALEIVAKFSDEPKIDSSIIEDLQFINQEHYQDITEERAINKLCGYPLCTNKLKNVPTKQYHISTTHNKVFDITDRKNFCSNLCYKASKYLKDQISTSPVWLRENITPSTFKLIPLHSKGGIAGDEVDFGITAIKADFDDVSVDKNSSTELIKDAVAGLSNNSGSANNKASYCSNTNDYYAEIHQDKTYLCDKLHDARDYLSGTNIPQCIEVSKILNSDITPELLNKSNNQNYLNDSKLESTSLDISININSLDSLTTNDTSTQTANAQDNIKLPKSNSKLGKKSSKRKGELKNVQNLYSPTQNIVMKIEGVLKEWFSMDSLCFIFGEQKIKEILAEKKNSITKSNNISGTIVNAHVYEQYLAICRKLNILELEDTKLDSSFREEVKRPLPNFEILKEEAKKMELKVKMFYKGDKVVQFENSPEDSLNGENEKFTQEPILPLVDLHAQKALRRRIVNDKLRKVLQDLQKSLGLRSFNLNENVRTLVTTFTLSAHNITLKPAEWNLTAIVIIKVLSISDRSLQQALASESTNKYLTLLLMSYSLDGGYLDRLIEWLTDFDSMLQKSE